MGYCLMRRSSTLFSSTKKYSALYSAVIIAIFSLSACSVLEPKPEAPVKSAEQIAAEKKKAKKAAEQQALAEEDVIQTEPPKAVEKLKEEKIPVAVPAPVVESVPTPIASAKKLDIPTEPNTYLITADEKTKNHPNFGAGNKLGFSVNGIEGGYVIAKRGETTTFKVRTGVKHDFYLTTSPKGWGAAVFTDGVENQFTYQDDVKFIPSADAPDHLYYGCRNHDSMGGKIVVVDEGDDFASIEDKLKKEHAAKLKENAQKADVSIDPQKVNQKIAYVKMLLQFKGKNLPPAQLQQIKDKLAEAEKQQKSGNITAAMAYANEANAHFNAKVADSGPTKEELEEAKEEFNDQLITLEAFIDSHKATYDDLKKRDKSKLVDYDHDVIGAMISDAQKSAKKNDYKRAGKLVKQAERIVTKALNDMYAGQTAVVYDLNFETPQEEFDYEVKRYLGYEELIPVAIEVKKPKESSIKLMQTYVDKGRFFKEKAEESAKAGRWDEALVVIKDATNEVRRGLRLLGVSM